MSRKYKPLSASRNKKTNLSFSRLVNEYVYYRKLLCTPSRSVCDTPAIADVSTCRRMAKRHDCSQFCWRTLERNQRIASDLKYYRYHTFLLEQCGNDVPECAIQFLQIESQYFPLNKGTCTVRPDRLALFPIDRMHISSMHYFQATASAADLSSPRCFDDKMLPHLSCFTSTTE